MQPSNRTQPNASMQKRFWVKWAFLTLLILPNLSQAQALMRDSLFVMRAMRGVDAAYDMRFDVADRIFGDIERQYPQHPAGPFLKALSKWWRILSDLGDNSVDHDFHSEMTTVSQRCDRLLAQNPNNFDAILFKGMAVGFRSRLFGNRSSWVNAFRYGKEAVEYVTKAAQVAPENNDYYFGWGVYDYFAAVLPGKYPAMKYAMWFLPRGSRERGLEEIKRTFNRGTFMRAESAYYLFQINYVYEPRYEGAKFYIGWLRQNYPNNSFYHILQARMYNYFGDRESAIREAWEIIKRFDRKQSGYSNAIVEQAYYLLSGLYLFVGEYEQAKNVTIKLLMLNGSKNPSNYHVLGRLRMGMVYDAMKDRPKAKEMYNMVLRLRDVSDSRKRAKAYLERPYYGVR